MRLILLGFWAISDKYLLVFPTAAVVGCDAIPPCPRLWFLYSDLPYSFRASRASEQTGRAAGALQCLSSPLSTSESTPWSHLEDQRTTSCMLIICTAHTHLKMSKISPPFFPSRGICCACRKAGAHPEHPCGSHWWPGSLLWPCKKSSVGQSPGVAQERFQGARAAWSIPQWEQTQPSCCQGPGWCCCTSPRCAAHTQDRDPHTVPVTFSKPSILPSSSSGKKPLSEGWLLHPPSGSGNWRKISSCISDSCYSHALLIIKPKAYFRKYTHFSFKKNSTFCSPWRKKGQNLRRSGKK